MKFSFWNNKNLKKIREDRRGFTLVELLIAMTVFAVFIGTLASSYLFLTRAQRDTNELRKVYSEGRFLMDEMISVVRGSEVAYGCYNAVLSGDGTCEGSNYDVVNNEISGTVLAVMRPDGKRVVVRAVPCDGGGCYDLEKVVQFYNGEVGQWVASNPDGYFDGGGDNGFQTLNLEKIEVENVHFRVVPGDMSSAVSPYVQIYLSLNGMSQLREEVDFDIQTTVSFRDY